MEFERKYNTATTIYIPVIKAGANDQALSTDWTPAAGDVTVVKDGGTAANITTLPTAITMGNGAVWKFSLSATEMTAAEVVVNVSDSATKAVEDQMFMIATFGNASAEYATDRDDAVRGGMTALPNANAGAAGGLPTDSTGKTSFNDIAATAIVSGGAITTSAGAVSNVTLVATTTTNTDMRGTDNAALATDMAKVPKSDGTVTWNPTALASINAEADTALTDYDAPTNAEMVAAFTEIKGATWSALTDTLEFIRNKQTDIETDTAEIGTAGAGLTNLGGMSTTMKAEVLAEVVKVLVTQMTESYAADGVAPTPAQALFLIQQALTEFAYSGTSFIVKKLDGTTTAATMTLDDATTPTSATRTG